jgi:UDP-2,3-diacylglucosamine pyrophosphatase LpxH
MSKIHYKTIVISDVHLGSTDSKAKELIKFLKLHSCDKLIMNGDIIDGWQLRRSGKWKKKHTSFFRMVLKMVEKQNTKVIYTRGNHDDFLDNVVPFTIGNLSIVKEYEYKSNGKKYWVIHGDIFDSVTTNMRWLAMLGDVGYTFLLWLNKVVNYWRMKRNKPYFSLSKYVKAKVKSALSYISDYENQLVKLAHARNYDGIICGHIHEPAIKNISGIEYLNSGDWVESMSALVEDEAGNWKIVYYDDLIDVESKEPVYSAFSEN